MVETFTILCGWALLSKYYLDELQATKAFYPYKN
jgi:hypothetical protein